MAIAPRRFLVRYRDADAKATDAWHRAPKYVTAVSGYRTRADAQKALGKLIRKGFVGHVDTYDHLRVLALAAARRRIGIREEGGNNIGAEVEAIIRRNGGMPGEPWCGDFDASCYLDAGSKAVTRSWAAVRLLGRGRWVKVLPKLALEPGDLIRYVWEHTGIFERYVAEFTGADGHRYWHEVEPEYATHVECIEGNTTPGSARSDSAHGGDGVYPTRRPLAQVQDGVMVLG